MKAIAGSALLMLTLVLASFTPAFTIDDISAAMKAGDAEKLAKYFDDRIELTFPDKGDMYSKAQAQMIMKDFFELNPVKGFTVKHKGENKGAQFMIGNLQTKNRDYQARFFLKKKGDVQVIQDITFELDKKSDN
ncbi:MAG: DUF4783 domain-containing protein [Flavitalea sp.]